MTEATEPGAAAYAAYAQSLDWADAEGRELPPWEEQHGRVVSAFRDAATALHAEAPGETNVDDIVAVAEAARPEVSISVVATAPEPGPDSDSNSEPG